MLEIFFLAKFCKSLAATAREKNRPTSWAALGALLWIGGEITGAVIGVGNHANGMNLYGAALIGAVIGAVVAWMVVKNLSTIPNAAPLPTARVV